MVVVMVIECAKFGLNSLSNRVHEGLKVYRGGESVFGSGEAFDDGRNCVAGARRGVRGAVGFRFPGNALLRQTYLRDLT